MKHTARRRRRIHLIGRKRRRPAASKMRFDSRPWSSPKDQNTTYKGPCFQETFKFLAKVAKRSN